MWKFMTVTVEKFGLPAAAGLVFLVGAIWGVAYWTAQPGTPISVLGLITYTKAGGNPNVRSPHTPEGPKMISLAYEVSLGGVLQEKGVRELEILEKKRVEKVGKSDDTAGWELDIFPDGSYQARVYDTNGNRQNTTLPAHAGGVTATIEGRELRVWKASEPPK